MGYNRGAHAVVCYCKAQSCRRLHLHLKRKATDSEKTLTSSASLTLVCAVSGTYSDRRVLVCAVFNACESVDFLARPGDIVRAYGQSGVISSVIPSSIPVVLRHAVYVGVSK